MPCCAIAVGTFSRSAMPCFSASLKSTIQRMPSSSAGWSSVAAAVSFGFGPTAGSRSTGAPSADATSAPRAVATAIQRCGIARASGARCQVPPVGSFSIAAGVSFGSTGKGWSAGIGADGQSPTLVGLNARAIHAARCASKRSQSCCHARRSPASSRPARQICCQKCWPHRNSSCDKPGSCESTCT